MTRNMNITFQNHIEIEGMDVSPAFKVFEHFCEVINNDGSTDEYNDNVPELLAKLDKLTLSDDIKLCYDILNDPEITQDAMLNKVKIWSSHQGKGISHDCMVQMGIDNKWTNIQLLGQLWELYNDLILG